jgi:hypothetical protein
MCQEIIPDTRGGRGKSGQATRTGAASPPRCETGAETCEDRLVIWTDQLAEYRARFADFLRGAAFGRYEQELRQQTAELNDLFLLLCFMEATALPNPATLYLLEIYPYLLEQFHEWHRRMGIEHSPIGSLPCC